MSRPCAIGLTSAFITRIQEQVFDPQLIATLQERLDAHGAASIALVAQLLQRRQAWTSSRPSERKVVLKESLKPAGLSALAGAGLSLVVSMALALMPSGQILITNAIISSATRLELGKGEKAFSLLREEKNTEE